MSRDRDRRNGLLPLKGDFAELRTACDATIKRRGLDPKYGRTAFSGGFPQRKEPRKP